MALCEFTMNENNNFETIEIPDILLELNGLRTANKVVSAEKILEAENILASGRFVEAGVGDFLKNLIKGGRVTPEEVATIIARLKGLGTSAAATTEQKLHSGQMIEFLESLNKETGGFIRKPFQKGMSKYWKEVDELAQNAEKAGAGANNTELDTLQQAMGTVGSGIDDGLGRGFMGTNRFLNMFTKNDKELIKKTMPGVYKIGDNQVKTPISFEEFFTGGYLNAGGGASQGKIFMSDPNAVKMALAGLSKDVGASARMRGWLNLTAQTAAAGKLIVPVATAGGTMWAFGQGIKHAPSQSDYDQVENPSFSKPEITESNKTNLSGGLGGTTNGNNIGGLGGQYNPKPNNGWNPPKPNLQNNPNDWLPTNTSDYYNLVDRKSDLELDNTRFAQLRASNIESVDEAVRNVLTILEQGAPGKETLNRAIQYLHQLNQQIKPELDNFYAQLNSSNNVEPEQVKQV